MTEASRAPRVTVHADEVLTESGIRDNPYLRALEDGTMTLDCFRRTQEQFFFAVTFFPRPMAAMVGRIPDPRSRLDILHNLVEEHGEFHEELFHHNTFQRFLRTLGSDPGAVERGHRRCRSRISRSCRWRCSLDQREAAAAAGEVHPGPRSNRLWRRLSARERWRALR